MTLSEDEVNFDILRVITKKLKNELADQALKLKDRILEATYQYCNDTVADIQKSYKLMQTRISHDPQNERELIETKEFIAKAPMEIVRLTDILKEVEKHHEMLEEFSYMYKDQDIDQFFLMKIWPLRI
jgi:hypothetical protein